MKTKMLWAAVASLLMAGVVSGISMQSATAETDGGGIVPVTNWRLFETTAATPMYSGQTKTLQVTGIGGVPSSGVSAVVVSVSASSAKSVYVTVAPSGSGQTHSQLSVQQNAGWDSNTAIVRVSSTGKVDLSVSGGATQVKLDIQGYVTSDATTDNGGFVAITQARIARSDTGDGFASTAALVGGWNYVVDVAGVGGVPSDATAVFANVRVFSATGSGGLRVGPSTLTAGSQSALIYQASGAYDSAALVRLGTDGKIRLFASAGTNVHVMIDVQGYVTPGDDGAGFTPIVPQSILTADAPGTEIEGGDTREVQVTGIAGIPEADDVGAAMFDFIATTWTSTGSLSLYDAEDAESSVYQLRVEGSSTNVPERTTVIARVSADGAVKITNHGTSPVGVRIAVQGWFSPTASQVAERAAAEVEEDVPSEPGCPEELDPAPTGPCLFAIVSTTSDEEIDLTDPDVGEAIDLEAVREAAAAGQVDDVNEFIAEAETHHSADFVDQLEEAAETPVGTELEIPDLDPVLGVEPPDGSSTQSSTSSIGSPKFQRRNIDYGFTTPDRRRVVISRTYMEWNQYINIDDDDAGKKALGVHYTKTKGRTTYYSDISCKILHYSPNYADKTLLTWTKCAKPDHHEANYYDMDRQEVDVYGTRGERYYNKFVVSINPSGAQFPKITGYWNGPKWKNPDAGGFPYWL